MLIAISASTRSLHPSNPIPTLAACTPPRNLGLGFKSCTPRRNVARACTSSTNNDESRKITNPGTQQIVQELGLAFHTPVEVLESTQDYNPVEVLESTQDCSPVDVLESMQDCSPVEVLERLRDCSPSAFWVLVDYLHTNGRTSEALQVFEWWKSRDEYQPCELHYTKVIRMLGQARMPESARVVFTEMCEAGIRPSAATFTYLLQGFAERGLFEEAEAILRDMVASGDAKPNTITYTGLIHAYGKHGKYDSMWRTFNRMKTHRVPADAFTYRALLTSYAKGGLFHKLQLTLREIRRHGMSPDAATTDAIILAYAKAGLIKEMEAQYALLSSTPSENTIRAMVWAYIKGRLFFQLSALVKRVGLRSNFLWNALLLSRAGSFSLRNLVLEFGNMRDAGVSPDVTACNVMVLAYSRAKKLRELREFVVAMQDSGLAPDLVTYGAVVDVFTEEAMRPRLLEELVEFRNLDVVAEVETDPVVFEVFGKGRFHLACERQIGEAQSTYAQLVGRFLQSLNKKQRASSAENG